MADQQGGNIIQKWAQRLGLGQPTGIDLPGEVDGLVPTPGVAQPPLPQEPDRPALDAGRQRQPRGRAGRPAGRPAADGGRLQRDRQRRPRRHAARRAARRGHDGPRPAGDRAAAAAQARHLSPRPARRSCRACARPPTTRAAPRRRCSTASRSRSPARPARPSAAPRATSPGTWSTAPYDDPRIVVAVTIERGGFGAEAAAPAARRILAAYFGIKGKKAVGTAGKRARLMADAPAARHPVRHRRAALQRAARAASASARLPAAGGDARAARVQPRDARRGDRDRRPGAPGLLRRPGRPSTPSSGSR